jgi:hypothetical protein
MSGPRSIVVDASVLRAASFDGGAPAPACARCLEVIRSAGLHLAVNAALYAEWNKHQGRFAIRWLQDMVARRRLRRVHADWDGEIALIDAANEVLSLKDAQDVHKDRHLVALARLTDDRVLSLDDAQARLLRSLIVRVQELSQIHWVSPLRPTAEPWLDEGAPDDASLTLGHTAP